MKGFAGDNLENIQKSKRNILNADFGWGCFLGGMFAGYFGDPPGLAFVASVLLTALVGGFSRLVDMLAERRKAWGPVRHIHLMALIAGGVCGAGIVVLARLMWRG